MSTIKRINISIDEALHNAVKVLAAEQGTNISQLVCTHLASLVQDFEDKPITAIQEYNAYQAMSPEERLEVRMAKAREEHAIYEPQDEFDEEHMKARWTKKIIHEFTEEAE